MYYVDANRFMNAVLVTILVITAILALRSLFVAGRKGGRGKSYLYMLTALFGTFSAVVLVLGFRGQTSTNRPWHFFLDMKYQAKYTTQGASKFFADGRAMRLPPENTVP